MTLRGSENLTIPGLFAASVAARGDEPALGVVKNGELRWRSWRQLADVVGAWAAELAARGVVPGDRVAQLSPNCEGWILADLAIQQAGAVHVPLHVSLGPAQIARQIVHCGARLVLSNSEEQAERIRPEVGPSTPIALHAEMGASRQKKGLPAGAVPGPDDLATILYTSGTTGPPRGVMLTQRNLSSNAIAMVEAIAVGDEETRLNLLPLSHIYARTCDLYCWIYRGTRLVLAESRDTVLRDCKLVRPTGINAVPYFYQKAADAVRRVGADPDGQALREYFGGEINMCYCGGAALATEVEQYFAERGLPILCGYGLTEAAPVITASSFANHSPGSVGRPLGNLEVRLAEDGEVIVRGPSIMRGYWQNEADTALILRDGWLHTGDLGQWDAAGNLHIVGRKKEMIVLATGKKVAPTHVEQLLTGSPWIEQCCVIGDAQKCLAALIVPERGALEEEIRRRELTAAQVTELYRREIDRCLAGAADFEQVGPFTLLARSFSIERGELTPKLSMCRKVIEQNFSEDVKALYLSRRPTKGESPDKC